MKGKVKKISIVMAMLMVFTIIPSNIVNAEQIYQNLYDINEIIEKNESNNSNSEESYVALPNTDYELEMGKIYRYDVIRSGNKDKKQKVTVCTTDISAGYGENYEILMDVNMLPEKVDGEKKLLMDSNDAVYRAYDMGDKDAKQNEEALNSQIESQQEENNEVQLQRYSSEKTIEFEEGQDVATFYIRTIKTSKAYGNLNFSIGLKDATNGLKVNEIASTSFTIKDDREAEKAELTIDKEVQVDYNKGVVEVGVTRSNNLQNYCTYSVKTNSDTAIAGEDYMAVSDSYVFTPGMRKQIIEIPIIRNGQTESKNFQLQFKAEAGATISDEDITNIELVNTGEYVNSTNRVTYDTLDTDSFNIGQSTTSENYKKKMNNGHLDFVKLYSEAHYGFSIVSPNKINWRLYEGVSVLGNHDMGGKEKNCKLAIYAGSKDNGKNTFDAGEIGPNGPSKNHISDDIGYSWDVDKISKNPGDWEENMNSWATLNVPIKYESSAPLYITLQQSKSVNHADYLLDTKIKLNKKKFTVNLLRNSIEAVTAVRSDGSYYSINPVDTSSLAINNPISTANKNDITKSSTDVYSGETIIFNKPEECNKYVKLSGFAICDKDGNVKENFYDGTTSRITIDDRFINKYYNYIEDNTINIVPVYSQCKAGVTVSGQDKNFKVNDKNQSASYMADGKEIAKVTWDNATITNERNGLYHSGDEFSINTVINSEYKDVVELVGYKVISSTDKNVPEDSGDYIIHKSTNGRYKITLEKNMYYRIIPIFTNMKSKVLLYVKNASKGDFIGKPSDLKADQYTDEIFADESIGKLLTFIAKPADGYEAKWTYKDAITEENKEIYGNRFYYIVQASTSLYINNISLEFVKISDRKDAARVEATVNAEVNMQKGTLMTPPTIDDKNYEAYNYAKVMFEEFNNKENGSAGKYTLYKENKTYKQDENGNTVTDNIETISKINVGLNDTYTVLINANGKNYVKQVKIADYYNEGKINFKFDLGYYNSSAYVQSTSITSTGLGTITRDVQVLKEMQLTTMNFKVCENGVDVNTLRVNVYSSDGIKTNHYDVKETKEGENYYSWSQMLTESINPGDRLAIELLNVSSDGDDSSQFNEVSYGETDLGMEFVKPAEVSNVGYLPDIGAKDQDPFNVDLLGVSLPLMPSFAIGNMVKPMCQINFDYVKNTMSVLFGVSLGGYDAFNNKSAPNFDQKIKQIDGIMKKINATDTLKENAGLGRKAASGAAKVSPVSFNIILKATVAAQVTLKIANKGTEKETLMVVGIYMFIGADATARVVASAMDWGIPVYVNGSVTGKFSLALMLVPVHDLAVDKLADSEAYLTDCINNSSLTLGLDLQLGVGLGIDNVLGVCGSVICSTSMNMVSMTFGKVILSLSGQIKLDLLLGSLPFNIRFVDWVIYDNTNLKSQQQAIEKQAKNEISKVENTKLKDINMDDLQLSAPLKRGVNSNGEYSEKVMANSSSEKTEAKLIPINKGKYAGKNMILLIAKSDEEGADKYCNINYAIVEKNGDIVKDFESVSKKIAPEDFANADFNPSFVDAGDYIGVSWSTVKNGIKEESINDVYKNIGNSMALFNKETGEFEKYTYNEDGTNSIVKSSMAYDEKNNKIVMMYNSNDYSKLTEDSTVEEIKMANSTVKYQSIDISSLEKSSINEVQKEDKYVTYSAISSIDNVPYISYQESNIPDTQDTNSKTKVKLARLQESNGEYVVSNTERIDDDDSVDSRPFFVKTKYDKDGTKYDDTLLMWAEGKNVKYRSLDAIEKLKDEKDLGNLENYLKSRIAFKTDTIGMNNDFTLVSNDSGNIYALFTTNEGKEKQIYASRFEVNSFDLVNEKITYDEDDNEIKTNLNKPIYDVSGTWGSKMKLTTKGVYNSEDHGLYKKSISAIVEDDGKLTAVYNAYDFKISEEDGKAVSENANNEIILSTFDVKSKYDFIVDPEVETDTPLLGEGQDITVSLINTGLDHGKNVPISLYEITNNEKKLIETKIIEEFPSGSSKELNFKYSMPKKLNDNVVLQVETPTSVGKVNLNNSSILKIDNIEESAAKYFYKDEKGAIKVKATITNTGNKKAEKGKVVLDRIDKNKLVNKEGNPNVTIGTADIPALDIGESVTVDIYSSELNKEDFNGFGGDMEYVLSSYDGEEVSYSTTSSLAPIPVPDTISLIEGKDTIMTTGTTKNLNYEIYPRTSAPYSEIEFTSDDESIATVNEYGAVTAVKEGNANISIKDKNGEAIGKVQVKVTDEVIDNNNNNNGDSNISGDDADGTNAKTGNINNIYIYCIILFFALAAIVYCSKKRRIS